MSPSHSPDNTSPQNPQEPNGTIPEKGPERKPPSGRDERGRFAPGNGGGPGNPFARQVAKLRAALVQRVTEEDMAQIAEQLIVQAKSGNMAAIKLLFQYVLGKPADTVNPDTLDIEEWRQCYQPLGQIMEQVPQTMETLPAKVACGMVAHIQPCRVHELGAVLSLPQQQVEELRKQADDTSRYGELLREAARSPGQEKANGKKDKQATRAPSTNGVGGAATTGKGAAARGRAGETREEPPSTNGHGGGERRSAKNGDLRGEKRRGIGGAAAAVLAILLGRNR
jgi:hypothetical protein